MTGKNARPLVIVGNPQHDRHAIGMQKHEFQCLPCGIDGITSSPAGQERDANVVNPRQMAEKDKDAAFANQRNVQFMLEDRCAIHPIQLRDSQIFKDSRRVQDRIDFDRIECTPQRTRRAPMKP